MGETSSDRRDDAPRSDAEASSAGSGPRTPGPGTPKEPPPFGGRWTTLYLVVLGTLAVLIVLFYAFTKAFE